MNLLYRIVHGFAWLVGCLPMGLLRAVARTAGHLGYRLAGVRRQVAIDNLRQAYPQADDAWLQATARGVFESLAQTALECFKLVRYSPAQIADTTRVHGLEHVLQVQAQGKGVIYLSAHLGNWEWMLTSHGAIHEPVVAVTKVLEWEPADRLATGWRTKTGNQVFDHLRSGIRLYKTLRRGGGVGILLDQSMDWYDGIWVDFFGRAACTSNGMAGLAMATGAAVIPAYCLRAADGKFDLYFESVVQTVNTGDKRQDEWDNTQNYTKVLERMIRRHPEQWLWAHRRWKHRPCCPWPREDR